MSKGIPIGLITGIIGKEMEADFWGSLEAVAGIGYEGIEVGPGFVAKSGLSVPALRERLEDLGLKTISYACLKKNLVGDALKESVQRAKILGTDYIVLLWAPAESKAELLEAAEEYNRIGQTCKENGIQFCYHNHAHEFETFDGQRGIDILFENTAPDLFQWETDVAWVKYGGVDPAEYIRKYTGRCPLIHAKDIADLDQEKAFIEVGSGVLDMESIVETAEECGAEWLIVEQDRPWDLAPMDSVKVSYQNLKEMVE